MFLISFMQGGFGERPYFPLKNKFSDFYIWKFFQYFCFVGFFQKDFAKMFLIFALFLLFYLFSKCFFKDSILIIKKKWKIFENLMTITIHFLYFSFKIHWFSCLSVFIRFIINILQHLFYQTTVADPKTGQCRLPPAWPWVVT